MGRAAARAALGVASLLAAIGVVVAAPASDPDPRPDWLHRVETARSTWRGPAAAPPTVDEITRRVADERRMEQALVGITGAPLEPQAIAREWSRMVERSRDPARLAALAAALDFDRLALVETLARPALVERRLRALWEAGEPASSAARAEIEGLRAALDAGTLDPRAPHPRRESVLYLPPSSTSSCPATLLGRDDAQFVDDPARWEELRGRWAEDGRPGPVVPTPSAVLFEVRLAQRECGAVEVARYAAPAVTFPDWWSGAAAAYDAVPVAPAPDAGDAGRPSPPRAARSRWPGRMRRVLERRKPRRSPRSARGADRGLDRGRDDRLGWARG